MDAGDKRSRGRLAQQAAELGDFLLNDGKVFLRALEHAGRSSSVESLRLEKSIFDRERRALIGRLVAANEDRRAVELGEKYLDFESLIETAEKLMDPNERQSQLDDWKEQFLADGFSEFLYEWYLRKGQF